MVTADLLETLRCPQTQQKLVLAEPALLTRISACHAAKGGGTIDAALIRSDGAVAYPVYDDIPVLLAEEAITL